MDEIEVINILKRCSDKKTERVIKSPVFLFSAAIWSHLADSWLGLNFMCKEKYKNLEIDKYIIITTSTLFKRFVFRVCFICLDCYMHLSKFAWKLINALSLGFHYI